MSDYAGYARAACDAALQAGKIILKYYTNGFDVEFKQGDDPVTQADREADHFLRETLTAKFPETGWLSEETADSPVRLARDLVWVVDPLDGTREFVARVPEFAISIGLVDRGEPVVGVIYNPAANRFWKGWKGGGVWEGDRRCERPSGTASSRPRALVSRTDSKKGWFAPFGEKYDVVARGSVAYKLACLASGDGDLTFTVTPRNEWDICAGVLLAKESGYRVTNSLGGELRFNEPSVRKMGVCAARPECQEALLSLLKLNFKDTKNGG